MSLARLSSLGAYPKVQQLKDASPYSQTLDYDRKACQGQTL
jgi:hypothetical protein